MQDWRNLWKGMPEFIQDKKQPFFKGSILFDTEEKPIVIRCETSDDLESLCKIIGEHVNKNFYCCSREWLSDKLQQKITDKTKSIWHPFKSHWGGVTKKYISNRNISNKYPVYVVSKGRYNNGLTTKALSVMNVKHYIVVEQEEELLYNNTKNIHAEILVLPTKYLDDYDTCDSLGNSKSKGPGAARNFCIDHSISLGYEKHWVLDDNIDAFHYLNLNEKYEVECASTLRACEDFVDRFSNVPVSGMNYYSFCKKTDKVPAFITNTRIYSCLLIDNKSGYRWRGRYNEDTDLSLRVLKDGKCTIQFNAFLCGKVTTQRMSGGNTKEFYEEEGTLPKSKMIEDLHPDVAKVVFKFNRWHHHINYKVFKNQLIIKDEYKNIDCGTDNYGLILVNREG